MPVLALAWSATMWLSAAEVRGEDRADYLAKVKPVLKEHCYSCHGALKQAGGLRLDTGLAIRRGGDSGPAVVPGRPEESPLIERIAETDADARMPFEAPALAPSKVAALRDWVAAGAPSPDGEEPEPSPKDTGPSGRSCGPPSRGRSAGPGPQPDRRFRGRRARATRAFPAPPDRPGDPAAPRHLDLIGLPPTREELHAFLADEAVDAYERVVDRLLASPQYGERWGRHWMDVWRYSDWYGRRAVPDVCNSHATIWRWRDWIVRSLNADKGYDRMVAEMLAADEIAPGDDDGARRHRLPRPQLVRVEPQLVDAGQRRAHRQGVPRPDDQLRPLPRPQVRPDPQDDYFRLRAFFEPIEIRQRPRPRRARPGPVPGVRVQQAQEVVRLGIRAGLRQEARGADLLLHRGATSGTGSRSRRDRAGRARAFLGEPPPIRPVDLPPAAFYPGLRPAVVEDGFDPVARRFIGRSPSATGPRGGLAHAPRSLPRNWPARRRTRRRPSPPRRRPGSRPWRGGSLSSSTRSAAGGFRRARRRVATARDGLAGRSRRASRARAARGELTRGAVPPGERGGPSRRRPGEVRPGASRECRVGRGREAGPSVRPPATPPRRGAWRAAAADRSRGEGPHRREARGRGRPRRPSGAAARPPPATAEAALRDPKGTTPYTPLSPVYPARSTGRRLALARWIADRENPLTARVAVNHIWARHFGTPRWSPPSSTSAATGPRRPTPNCSTGWPSSSMESGWSMKHIHRLIVTSQTYRMSSARRTAADQAGRDPENTFLWRMNPGRMEAEVVRDSLLRLAGVLDGTMGGQELENTEALTTRRRSLYYSCHPEAGGKSEFVALFDAPDANECYRRTRSVVPQQALALTNNPLIHELSGRLAAELGRGDGPTSFDAKARGVRHGPVRAGPLPRPVRRRARGLPRVPGGAGAAAPRAGRPPSPRPAPAKAWCTPCSITTISSRSAEAERSGVSAP